MVWFRCIDKEGNEHEINALSRAEAEAIAERVLGYGEAECEEMSMHEFDDEDDEEYWAYPDPHY